MMNRKCPRCGERVPGSSKRKRVDGQTASVHECKTCQWTFEVVYEEDEDDVDE